MLKNKALALAAAIGVLSGSSSLVVAQDSIKLGLSMPTQNSPYYQTMVRAFEATCKEKGYTCSTTDAQADIAKQVSDIEDLLQKGINALILNPRDGSAVVPAIKAAKEAGVPTFVIDSGVDASAPIVSIVQSDNQANGEAVGNWLAGQLGCEPVRIALISGNKGNVVGKIRRLSAISGIVEASLAACGSADVAVLAHGYTEWDAAGGLDVMEDILVAHQGKFNVVLSEADIMNIGALKALEAAGVADEVTIIASADGQKQAYELIMEGRYGATGLNSPGLVTETAMDLAVRYLGGERGFPRQVYTPPAAIHAGNVKDYYDPDSPF